MNQRTRLTLYSGLVSLLAILSACSSGDDNASKSQRCDLIANPDGPSYFKVINKLSTGLAWGFTDSFAFGADMKPGECVKMGLPASQYAVTLQQCNIADARCTSNIGMAEAIIFTVSQGKTYTLIVDGSSFK